MKTACSTCTAPAALKDNVTLFYFVVVVLLVAIVLLWRLVHSPFGKALQAIRMNETRARFVGYNVWLTKWAVVTLSGAFAGLSGGLLAIGQESAYPDVMSVHSSGFIVMAVLIGGGTVSFWGPVLGALVFIVARDSARRPDRDLAALVRAGVHGRGVVPARRHRWRVTNTTAPKFAGRAKPAAPASLRRLKNGSV